VNLTEALKVLSDHGYKTFTNEQLKEASEYFAALGFIKGAFLGLKLYVPKEVMERLEKGINVPNEVDE
jgi:hypothetical protein